MLRLAVDIGGTFTDAVILDEENRQISLSKVPSTPSDYSDGVTNSIRKLLTSMNDVESFTHGTTVGTNALIQGKVGKTGLLTTRGFRDILEIGRGNRVEIYDPFYKPPAPLIDRDKRLEVDERMGTDGKVLKPLDMTQASESLIRLAVLGVEAIAVSLINSYANSSHEEALRELARKISPSAYVTISTEISREYNEYERTSTVVINASLLQLMDSYLRALENSAEGMGYRGKIMLMQSNGGVMTSTLARRKPVHTINSGLVGGVIAVRTLSEVLGMKDLIGADMGGTSFDVELVVGGTYETTPVMKIQTPRSGFDGYPLQIPAVDIHAIGAGGGSVAWIDEADALHVGPMSAAGPSRARLLRHGRRSADGDRCQLGSPEIEP
jgi:N-methylhydantoinase A